MSERKDVYVKIGRYLRDSKDIDPMSVREVRDFDADRIIKVLSGYIIIEDPRQKKPKSKKQ